MDWTLKEHCKYCRIFIDDVTIFSDSFKDYIEHLNSVFSLFQEKNIGFNIKKSFIGYPSVELLGFYIDTLRMHSTEDRIQSFRQLEFPTTLKALETYLKATGFLRTMIPYYAQISDALYRRKTAMFTEDRQKGRVVDKNASKRAVYISSVCFESTINKRASFKELQKVICRKLTLYHPDPDKQLFL